MHEKKLVMRIRETSVSLHEPLRGTVVPPAKIRNKRGELDLEAEGDDHLKGSIHMSVYDVSSRARRTPRRVSCFCVQGVPGITWAHGVWGAMSTMNVNM